MKPKYLLFIALTAFIFISCNKSKKTSKPLHFDYGKVENSVYSNSFFKFNIQLPETWEILTQEQNQHLMETESEDKNLQSEEKSVNLLTALKNADETDEDDFFTNLSVIAEKLDGSDRVKNGTDYLMLTRKALDDTGIKREYPDKGTTLEKINGTEFSTMRVNTPEPGLNFMQKFYTMIVNGYALTFIATYNNEAQQAEMNNILKTLKFE